MFTNKAKIYLALSFSSVALFAFLPFSKAANIAEYNRQNEKVKLAHLFDVIDASLKEIAKRNLDLAKKTEAYLYSESSKKGIPQGVAELWAQISKYEQKDLFEIRIEVATQRIINNGWLLNGRKHEGSQATTKMFFSPDFTVPIKPDTPPVADGKNKGEKPTTDSSKNTSVPAYRP